MAYIKGTNKNDTLNGTKSNDYIYGFDGADTLKGGAGNDKLFGGTGSDNLYGGTGHNTLTGGGGIGQDNYYLTKGAVSPDTVVVPKGDSLFHLNALHIPTNFDRIFGFDKFDKLALDKKDIMGNTKGIVDPVSAKDTDHFGAFKIKDGVITLFDKDSHHHHEVKVNSIALAGEAYKFIIKNCLPINLDKAVALLVNAPDPTAPYNSGLRHAQPHTVVLEAHSGPHGSESITAVDIVGNFTNTISHQIVAVGHY